MRILFVWPIATFSVWDVARGYRNAFARILGEENVRDYHLNVRYEHHRQALLNTGDPVKAQDTAGLARLASETVLNEAIYFDADVVLVISGLNFHPIGLWLLKKVGIHAAAILTESPYDDINQEDWASGFQGMTLFTNDRTSAAQYGWHYLQHAYDPDVHRPVEPAIDCDVLMVGTGWRERQELFESMNWDGIDLQLYGVWPTITRASKLIDYMWPVCVDNKRVPELYCGSKICINMHRSGALAQSLNPRAYEIAACGAFQISDWRDELGEVFGASVPVFESGEDLERLIRYYLDNPEQRKHLAAGARDLVAAHTFDHRAGRALEIIERDIRRTKSRLQEVGGHA